jgi:cysteine desulfurase
MIYLDHAATTPILPEILNAMLPFLRENFGNPSSLHGPGRRARAAVEKAREQVAALVGAKPESVVFCASGSEANNLAIKGFAAAHAGLKSVHMIASAIEHPCVDQALRQTEASARNVAVSWAPPNREGVVEREAIERLLRPETRFVSLMAVNNETGALQPTEEVGRLCRERGIFFHVDACQAPGRMDVSRLGEMADAITVCAHKIYGPKGAAALIALPDAPLRALIAGGSQEGGRRAGTENVAALVGFGASAELAARDWPEWIQQARACEEALLASLEARGVAFELALPRGANAPGILNLAIAGLGGEELLAGLDLDEIAVSTGSACQSGAVEPSRVLAAMGFDAGRLKRSFRVSAGLASDPASMGQVAASVETLARRKRASLASAC